LPPVWLYYTSKAILFQCFRTNHSSEKTLSEALTVIGAYDKIIKKTSLIPSGLPVMAVGAKGVYL